MNAPYPDQGEVAESVQSTEASRVSPKPNSPSLAKVAGKVAAVVFVLIPGTLMSSAVVMGGILCAIEDWPFSDGYYSAASALTMSTVPLGDKIDLFPSTEGGRVFTILIGAWGMGFFGLFIVLLSEPLLSASFFR
eukprot:Sspe_Gene.56203::Locus_30919_Transcript_1_1_Confidence_1.000_Length_585::g.56203::m.56203